MFAEFSEEGVHFKSVPDNYDEPIPVEQLESYIKQKKSSPDGFKSEFKVGIHRVMKFISIKE